MKNNQAFILFALTLLQGCLYVSAEAKNPLQAESSKLVSTQFHSGNSYGKRAKKPSNIIIHHCGGILSHEKMKEIFCDQSTKRSATYGIDQEGKIAEFVEESRGAWTSGSRKEDMNAVTIEVSNNENGNDWKVSDKSFESLVNLCTDICLRNQIQELKLGENLLIHSMLNEETECPGKYLTDKMPELERRVNQNLLEGKDSVKKEYKKFLNASGDNFNGCWMPVFSG